MKPKLLCILHRSPPAHGAAKVGDFIGESEKLKEAFECRFITIKSSDTIGDIGKVNFKKLYLVVELYFKVLLTLLTFRPDKIYFTASVNGAAFYRDVLLSTLWKVYRTFKSVDVYYHYHTKGIDSFVSGSKNKLKVTEFFVKDINMVLLSPLLEKDLDKVTSYKSVMFLPNGIENSINDVDFENYLNTKYKIVEAVQVLYLAHMMKEKGYWEVLELANATKGKNIFYHFAGSWKDKAGARDFFAFVKEYGLEDRVVHHGFVSGEQKDALFKEVHLLIYPSKNDAFPLTILESLSYGVPVIATDEGSISYILDAQSGIVLHDVDALPEALEQAKEKLLNKETAMYCRQRYLDNFSLEQFEDNLVNVFRKTRTGQGTMNA